MLRCRKETPRANKPTDSDVQGDADDQIGEDLDEEVDKVFNNSKGIRAIEPGAYVVEDVDGIGPAIGRSNSV